MDNHIAEIRRIIRQCGNRELPSALEAAGNFIATHRMEKLIPRLDAIKDNYGRMRSYWLDNIDDAGRDDLYARMCEETKGLCCDIAREYLVGNSPFFKMCERRISAQLSDFTPSTLRARLEAFVSDLAMTELMPAPRKKEHRKKLMGDHQTFVDLLFEYFLIVGNIQQSQIAEYTALFNASTVDIDDRRLLLSAFAINSLALPCSAKVQCLLDIYHTTDDDDMRQRALVGWVLAWTMNRHACDKKTDREIAKEIANEDNTADIVSMQMQMLMAMDTDNMSKKVNDELLNEMKKSRQYRNVQETLEGKDVDHTMDEILNTSEINDEEDRMMDKIMEIQDLKKKGVDIFYGGFSQIKGTPFFQRPANWFVHFYIEHPDIDTVLSNTNNAVRSFCQRFSTINMMDTDKFAFICAMGRIFSKMPLEVVDKITESMPENTDAMDIHSEQAPADAHMLRYLFIKALYRFFTLFAYKDDFVSPFDKEVYGCPMPYVFVADRAFNGTGIKKHLLSIMKQMYKLDMHDELERLSDTIYEDMINECDDYDVLYFRGSYLYLQQTFEGTAEQHYENAYAFLDKAWRMNGTSTALGMRLAQTCYILRKYEQGKDILDTLEDAKSDDEEYMVLRAQTLAKTNNAEEAERILHKVNYLFPANVKMRNLLAELLIDRPDKLEMLLLSWIEKGVNDPADNTLRHLAYCYWLANRRHETVDMYAKHLCTRYGERKSVERKTIEQDLWLGLSDSAWSLNDIDKRLLADSIMGKLYGIKTFEMT